MESVIVRYRYVVPADTVPKLNRLERLGLDAQDNATQVVVLCCEDEGEGEVRPLVSFVSPASSAAHAVSVGGRFVPAEYDYLFPVWRIGWLPVDTPVTDET